MTEQPIVQSPSGDNRGRQLWVDGYLPPALPEDTGEPRAMIDTAWLRGALFRQRWLIAATLVLALIAGVVATVLATPIYEATSTVRVTPFGNIVVEGQEATAAIQSASEIDAFLNTQKVIVESRKLAAVVAGNLNAASRSVLLGPDIDASRPPGRTDEQWEQDKEAMAIAALQGSVTAQAPVEELIVTISFESEDPAFAAEAVNAYAEAYVQSDTVRSVEGNAYARQYLLEQIEALRTQLTDAEKAANAYARNSGIVTPDTVGVNGETGQTITGANLSSINQTVAQARAARIAAEQKWQAVSGIPAAQLPEVLNNPAIQNLTAERAKLNGELAILRERYNDQFPEIVDVKSRLALIEQQIGTTAANIKAAIRNEFVIAQRQEQALAGELDNVTTDALIEQEEKIGFTGLERNAQALRDQLTQLLDRYNQISTAANVQPGNLTLLDAAVVPDSPVSPSLRKNLLIAAVLGIALAGGLALAREIFVDQFRRAEDVEARLNLPMLGQTPYLKSDDLDGQKSDQFSTLLEAYASIRSTIAFALPHDGAVLQLTSSKAAEGKSTTSLILAELFARLGRKTLLIDCDLRKPSILPLLDLKPQSKGIAEVLLGQADLSEAVIDGVHENLQILSVASVPSSPVELLSSSRFREFIEAQREHYSLILIDSSPVLGLADAPQIAQCVDATVFVIEANRTSFSQASAAIKRIKSVGGNVIGAILTKYRALEAGADYNYEYQYYRYGDGEK